MKRPKYYQKNNSFVKKGLNFSIFIMKIFPIKIIIPLHPSSLLQRANFFQKNYFVKKYLTTSVTFTPLFTYKIYMQSFLIIITNQFLFQEVNHLN